MQRLQAEQALKLIKDTLSKPSVQRALIRLYSDSQSECTRNGKCGMEIGMSREKDLGAVLKYQLQDSVDLDIDNRLPEDCVVLKEIISVKHSQCKLGSAVKAKWTVAGESANDAIKSMIEAEDSYYPHLLIAYIDIGAKKISFVCITSENNRNTIKSLGKDAFKIPKGNSRGIEYSTAAMKELMKKVHFQVDILNADLKGGEDPIQKRMNIIKRLLESAEPSSQLDSLAKEAPHSQ
jgi:hypothetical protein